MYVKFRLPRGVLVGVFFLFALFSSICIHIWSPKAEPVSAENSISLPIVMYHSFLKDTSYHNDYCVSPTVLENDLKYLKENGFTTVTVKDLIEYVNGGELPQKVVMLTFDDGYYNNYYYAMPLLKKYNCKAVISPIASMSEKYTMVSDKSVEYGYCSFAELKKLQDSGYFEIANHSYDMHYASPRLGMEQIKGETDAEYKNTIENDIKKAQNLFKSNNIKEPLCLTYPYGIRSKNTLEIAKNLGFKCTMTCEEKTNLITKDSACLYELGRYNRLAKESSNTFFERICT